MNITPKKMRVGNSALPASNDLAGAKTRLIRGVMETYFQNLVQEVVKKWTGITLKTRCSSYNTVEEIDRLLEGLAEATIKLK
jgi:selenocysteine lyase/cysteine desulfurase